MREAKHRDSMIERCTGHLLGFGAALSASVRIRGRTTEMARRVPALPWWAPIQSQEHQERGQYTQDEPQLIGPAMITMGGTASPTLGRASGPRVYGTTVVVEIVRTPFLRMEIGRARASCSHGRPLYSEESKTATSVPLPMRRASSMLLIPHHPRSRAWRRSISFSRADSLDSGSPPESAGQPRSPKILHLSPVRAGAGGVPEARSCGHPDSLQSVSGELAYSSCCADIVATGW